MSAFSSTSSTSRKTIPVFFAVDDNYAPYLAVAIRSLVDHAGDRFNYHIHILISNLNEQHIRNLTAMQRSNIRIEMVNVNERVQALGDHLHLRDYYTHATYYRFFIPDLFPEYDRALYLDCDIVINRDVALLFNAPLGDCMLGAVADDMVGDFDVFGDYAQAVVGVPRERYFNAGILVMNLNKMRRSGLHDAFLSLLRKRTFRVAQDQDYLNVLCYGDVALLDRAWNVNAREGIACQGEPSIVHYKINWKPWHYKGVCFEHLFWQYADKTPYAAELYDKRERYSDEQKARDQKQYEGLAALAREETEQARTATAISKANIGV